MFKVYNNMNEVVFASDCEREAGSWAANAKAESGRQYVVRQEA